MESLKYLDRCRKLTKTGSDYALAKLLGVSENAINHYRAGERIMDDYACLRVSQILGVPLEEVVAAANYDREPDEKKKLEWARHLKKLVPSFALSVCLLPIVASWPTERGEVSAFEPVMNYATKLARIIRQLFAHFPALRAPSGPGCPAAASALGL